MLTLENYNNFVKSQLRTQGMPSELHSNPAQTASETNENEMVQVMQQSNPGIVQQSYVNLYLGGSQNTHMASLGTSYIKKIPSKATRNAPS